VRDLDLESIRLLGETGEASCVCDLLDNLAAAVASIPSIAAVLPGDDLAPAVSKVESIAKALAKVLSRSANELTQRELESVANLADVRYQVQYYYPPAALNEVGELTISFESARRLAENATEERC
jgi:hypothetical protein